MQEEILDQELDTTLDETEQLDLDIPHADELEQVGEAENMLFIPEVARNFYESKGYDLQWVRIYSPDTNGELDKLNIQKREARGYSFVPRKEVPGLNAAMTSYFGEQLTKENNGLYIIGDLALAKYPLSNKAARRAKLENITKSKNEALISDLRKNSVSPNAAFGEEFKTVRQQPKPGSVEFGD